MSPAVFGEHGTWGGGERYAVELARAQAGLVPTRLVTVAPHSDNWTDGPLQVAALPQRFRFKGHELNSLSEQLMPHIAASRIVHIHQYNTALTTMCLALAQALRRPAFVTDHGGSAPNPNRRLSAHRWVTRYLAVSEFATTFFPEMADRSSVIYGGVDESRFSAGEPASARKGVVCVARIMPHKGIDVLVRAVDAATPLVVYGRPYDSGYRDYVGRLAEGKSITFVHDATDAEIVRAMQTARVLVLPSVYRTFDGGYAPKSEYLGLALIEAMACGTPVIGSRVGGIPEIIDDRRNGLLVEPGDVAQLRRAVEEVLDNDHRRWQEMSGACSRVVQEKFTWGVVARRCLDEYRARSKA